MNHPSEKTIHAFVDRALDEQAHRSVQRHLHECPQCCGEVRELEALFSDLGSIPHVTPPSTLPRQILKAQQNMRWGNIITLDLFHLLFGRTGMAAVAAGLIAGIVLGVSVSMMQPDQSHNAYDAAWSSIEEASMTNVLVADVGDLF